tara:strand:+ start:330 stop:560 length:231 start_codon:yes stop_codon:yes gene_type:complete
MQKLFNVMAVTSFLMSAGMLGGIVLLYSRIPGMITRYANSFADNMTEKVTEMIPEKIEEVMPELPTETGLPIKSPF